MEKIHILLLSLVVGVGIGLFPLLTGSVGVPPTQVVEAVQKAFPSEFYIDLDGQQLEWDDNKVDEEVMMVDGRVYVPVRVVEQMGGEVMWDGISRKVKVKLD